MTPYTKYDTACPMDKRCVRPWQPLKGISNTKNYVREFPCSTTVKLYKFKGAVYQKMFVHAVSLTPNAQK
jgi:hypothetical protein